MCKRYFASFNSLLQRLEAEAISKGYEYIDELVFENGAIYRGYLHNGLREGPGVQTWLDGAKYEGEWRANQANGLGKF